MDNIISSSPSKDSPIGLCNKSAVVDDEEHTNTKSMFKSNGQEEDGEDTNLRNNTNLFDTEYENDLATVMSEGSFYFTNAITTPTPSTSTSTDNNMVNNSFDSMQESSIPQSNCSNIASTPPLNINSNLGYSEFIISQHNLNSSIINEGTRTISSNNNNLYSLDSSSSMASHEKFSSLPNNIPSQNIVNWQQQQQQANSINFDMPPPSFQRRISEPTSPVTGQQQQPMVHNSTPNKFELPTVQIPAQQGYYPQIPIPIAPNPNQWPPITNYAPFFSASTVHPNTMIHQNQHEQIEVLHNDQHIQHQQPLSLHPDQLVNPNLMSPQHSTETSLSSSFRPELGVELPHENSTPKQNSFFKNILSSGKKKTESSEFKRDVILEGCLHKLTRSGVWQKRFFEVDGVSLTYYKTSKRIKLLATLDLVKVGSISVDDADPDGCTFTIQVSGRLYYLRAEDSATCKDWVINLNRVREARNEIGGLKLCTDGNKHLSIEYTSMKVESESTDYSPVFVSILPHRPRLHHLDTSEHINNSNSFPTTSLLSDRDGTMKVSPCGSVCSAPPTVGHLPFENSDMHYSTPRRMRPRERSPELFARWQKRRTKLQLMRSRLSSFIRWMTMKRSDTKHDQFAISSDMNYLNRVSYTPSYAEDGATAAETTVFTASTSTQCPPDQFKNRSHVSDPRIIS